MIPMLLLTSSVLILGIFCVRKLSLGRISMKMRYALWIPVALRLLFPFSVGESPISVMNVFHGILPEMGQTQAELLGHGTEQADGSLYGSEGAAAFSEKNGGSGEGSVESEGVNTPAQRVETNRFVAGQISEMEDSVDSVSGQRAGTKGSTVKRQAVFGTKHFALLRLSVCGVWFFGFAIVSGHMLLSRQRFMRYLKQKRSLLSEEALPEGFAGRLSARDMKVYQVPGLPSPCLVGKDIYIGRPAADDRKSLPHILAHEYCHALHRDGFWAFLRCFLAAVYWFDPLVWAAVYAARQDSELACDERAVRLLGESERFLYGRTLLNLLEQGDGKEGCSSMAFMLNRSENEKGVRERIGALTACGRKKSAAAVVVVLAALALGGCAFTGAAKDDADAVVEEADGNAQGDNDTVTDHDAQNRQMQNEENNEEFARIQKEYEEALENGELTKFSTVDVESKMLSKDEADQAAFEEALNYHGVMEGKDDSELFLNRQADVQAYYQYIMGEAENPMENGWYLLCENKSAGIALYGLYTEEFGFRGLKTLIGEDVNTFDARWCVSLMNSPDNIRVLEQAEDGLPRRFVWKLLAEESGTTEIWRFYYANRYDTGTVDMKMLSEEDCLAWAKEHLSFTVDQEETKVYVTYDKDMALGAIDISAYADWKVEDVQIMPDMVGFLLDDPGSDIYAAYSDAVWEASVVHLVVGLQFEGIEGWWFDELPVLTVQIAEEESSASGFRLDYPRIDETYVAHMPSQEKKLSELQDGNASLQAEDSAQGGWEDPERPFINGESEAHHDLEITFINPCPDFDRISDVYGERIHPVTQKVRTHTGVDLAAPEGADVLAAADGTVAATGFQAEMGNFVILWHEQSGQMSYYAHCKTVEVTQGQQVAQGEKIATVGQTGQATGPFLHFAISSGNNWEEPHFLELE